MTFLFSWPPFNVVGFFVVYLVLGLSFILPTYFCWRTWVGRS